MNGACHRSAATLIVGNFLHRCSSGFASSRLLIFFFFFPHPLLTFFVLSTLLPCSHSVVSLSISQLPQSHWPCKATYFIRTDAGIASIRPSLSRVFSLTALVTMSCRVLGIGIQHFCMFLESISAFRPRCRRRRCTGRETSALHSMTNSSQLNPFYKNISSLMGRAHLATSLTAYLATSSMVSPFLGSPPDAACGCKIS